MGVNVLGVGFWAQGLGLKVCSCLWLSLSLDASKVFFLGGGLVDVSGVGLGLGGCLRALNPKP